MNQTVIQNTIEQAKMKFNIHSKPIQESNASKQKDECLSESVPESLAEMVELEETMTQVKKGQNFFFCYSPQK